MCNKTFFLRTHYITVSRFNRMVSWMFLHVYLGLVLMRDLNYTFQGLIYDGREQALVHRDDLDSARQPDYSVLGFRPEQQPCATYPASLKTSE